MPTPIDLTNTQQLMQQCMTASGYRMAARLSDEIATAAQYQRVQGEMLVKAKEEIERLVAHIQTLENELAATRKPKWPVFNFLRKERTC